MAEPTIAEYERLSTLQLADRARAVKAERELAEACADLATQRRLAARMIVALERIRAGAGYYGIAAHGVTEGPARRMMRIAAEALAEEKEVETPV